MSAEVNNQPVGNQEPLQPIVPVPHLITDTPKPNEIEQGPDIVHINGFAVDWEEILILLAGFPLTDKSQLFTRNTSIEGTIPYFNFHHPPHQYHYRSPTDKTESERSVSSSESSSCGGSATIIATRKVEGKKDAEGKPRKEDNVIEQEKERQDGDISGQVVTRNKLKHEEGSVSVKV